MDLLTEKYKLMEWLMALEDESIVKRIQEIRDNTNDAGESYHMSDTEKLFLKAGLKDIEEGNTYSHEDVMREVRDKYGI